MKTQHRETILRLLILISLFCLTPNAAAEENPANALTPQPPYYELVLDINELTVFNQSVSDGLNKYGGSVNFEMNAAKSNQETLWKVTIRNPKVPDALKYWISEKSLEVVKAVNPDELTLDDKTALKVMKSLADKIENARNNPIYETVKISGTITEEDSTLFITGEGFQYPVTGRYIKAIKEMKGKPVIMHGVVKVKDQIEATHVRIKKENTLELFVMSLCPFGQTAETSIIDFIDTLPDDQKPDISIRYIFYLKNKTFTSLHGEPEVKENLVQMVIRDDFGQYFHPYLQKRSEDKKTSWQELAKEAGMPDDAVQTIEDKIVKERDALIQTEYNYAVGTYGITNRSPTFVWESDVIPDIRTIEIFKDLAFSTKEKCSHE